tara:strand:- start:1580 stop:2848 length:1269 start_codon:yes stop_codon:yes gene_type:complete
MQQTFPIGMKVAIIGLGYVGLPVACICALKHEVVGADIDKEKIDLLKEGKCPTKDDYLENQFNKIKSKLEVTSDLKEAVKDVEVVIICVPTPIDNNHKPNLTALKSATTSVSEAMKENTLVIIESTIFPGTTEEVVKPILDESGKKILLAHCPERIDPGNKNFTIENLPRVVGGIDKESSLKAYEFYEKIINAPIREVSSVKAAEATKIMENTFRDINIAFVNEMAKSFDKAGIDIMEVINAAGTKFSFMAHYPGVGVGGHCIPVDPYYLIEKAKQSGFNHEFLKLARNINESMPNYTVELLEKELGELKGVKIGVLGRAYKANVDDIRESPALKVIEILTEKGADISIFDPYVKKEGDVKDLNELLENSDYIILVTDHKEFKNMDIKKLQGRIKIVIDGRNCLDKEEIKSLGIKYRGIGRS